MPIVRLDSLQQFAAVQVLSDPGEIGGPVVIPNCAQIRFRWGLAGRVPVSYNVLHCRYVPPFNGTTSQANTIFDAIKAGANWTALALHLATSTGFLGIDIRNVHVKDQALIASSSAGVAGTSTGVALPNETALVVSLRTALAGRANRGRVYIPGWATTALATNNDVATAAVNALDAWFENTVRPTLLASGYTLAIGQPARAAYTGSTGTPHPARPAQTVDVTDSLVNNTWDSQRRRGKD